MQKSSGLILLALASVFCLCLIRFSAYAVQDQVLINDLIEKAPLYDGKTVTLTAEAIGERMERGDHAWINVNDGSNAIGIWMTSEESEKIKYYGDYRYTGDTVTVTGIYNRACSEHGGEPDIHCQNISVIKPGKIRTETISSGEIIAAVFFTVLGCLLFITLKTGNRRSRSGH